MEPINEISHEQMPEMLKAALGAQGVAITTDIADRILMTITALNEKGVLFSLTDAAKIQQMVQTKYAAPQQ